jgi:hypothetical protein
MTTTDTSYAFCSKKGKALHQGVVTMEILRHDHQYEVIYLASPSDALKSLLNLDHTEKAKVMVWPNAHQDVHPHRWMLACDTLTNECGAIFPPRE